MRAARRCHAQGALASAAGIKWSGRIRRHEDREPLPGVAIRDLDEEGKTRLARTRSRARPFGGRGTAHHPRAVGKRGLGIRRNSPVSVSRPLAASNPGFRRAVRCADFRISPEPGGRVRCPDYDILSHCRRRHTPAGDRDVLVAGAPTGWGGIRRAHPHCKPIPVPPSAVSRTAAWRVQGAAASR